MARKLAVCAAFGCAAVLFAAERLAIAAFDENSPASTEEALSEADSQDSTGPALSTPSATDEQQHGTSANAPHAAQWKYGQQSQQARTAPNRTPQRVAQRPDYRNYNQSYDQSRAQETQQNQQAQQNGAYYPPNSAPAKPQSRDAGMLPNYQQQQHKYSSEETSGQNNQPAEGQSWQRGQQSGNPSWQRTSQSNDWQSDQQQNRRPQQQNNVRTGYNGYPQSQNWNSNDPRSRNVSASYMDNGSPRGRQYDSDDAQGSGYPSSETMQYGPSNSQRGYSGYGNSGTPAWRLSMLPSPMPKQTTSVQYGRQAVVTPDAVYIDRAASNSPSESIGPGRMTYGRSLPSAMVSQGTLPSPTPAMNGSNEVIGPGQADGEMNEGPMDGGHMSMDHYGDGFTNPYCNSCNGCGGGCDQGPTCGGQCGGCGDDCCDDGCGGHDHAPYGRPWVLAPFDWLFGELADCHRGWWWAEDLTVFGGAQNFKNIANGGLNSSFGFNEGVNWGVPILPDLGISGQVGFEAVQSEFESPIGSRQQTFLTMGLFHRPWCDECWDAGVVFDWLHDDFFGNSFDIGQARGQIGYQWNRRNEFGCWFSTGVMQSSSFRVLDQYNLFYRRQFCRGGDWRIWGGFTGGNGQTAGGIIGSDFEIPVARRWAFEGGFNYYIPSDRGENGGLAQETWNVGCNLVWYLGGTAQCNTPYRPLFDVGNNGSLMTTLR